MLPHLWATLTGTAVALEIQAGPFGTRPIVDERMYVEWARRIAHGELLGPDVFFFDPLWAYVLAALLFLTHGSLLACRLFCVALFAGTVELVYRTARELFGERTALLAAAFTALFGPLAFATGFLLKEPLTVHLVAWAMYLTVRAEQRRWALSGLAFGLLALLRGNFLLLAPLPLVAARRHAGWAALGLALPLALSLAHNLAAGGQPVITTAHGGANFWLGNHAGASGTYDAPDFLVARPSEELTGFKAEAERRLSRPLTHAESSRYWLTEGLRFWAGHPGEALALTFSKVRLLLSDYEVPDNYAFTCFRGWLAPALWLAPLSWGLLFPLALLGLVRGWSLERARPLVVLAVLYGASVVAFFVFDRYRLPLAPLLCLFAAHGMAMLRPSASSLARGTNAEENRRELPDEPRRQFSFAFVPRSRELALVGVGLLVAFTPTAISAQRTWHEAQCLGTAGLQLQHDRDPAAQRWLDEATRLAPDTWPAEMKRRLERAAAQP
ncbi:MAG: glycosyltransferase family 39 protein [Archangiaceae bacterium]|nr:glycosyltransferase family 39 protein [Archangiaceae bacterium]